MGLQMKISFMCVGLVPIAMTVFAFPVILLARHSRRIGQLYYWLIFAVSECLCLSRADHHVRRLLFQDMHQDCRERRSLAGDKRLKVLEIGPGTGGNFSYYPPKQVLHLTTLELNPLLEKHAAQIKSLYPELEIENSLIGNAEDMSGVVADESFDAVVGTHILCCIRNPGSALREIHRVLKPVRLLFSPLT